MSPRGSHGPVGTATDAAITGLACLFLLAAAWIDDPPASSLALLGLLPALAWVTGDLHARHPGPVTALIRATWPVYVAPMVYLAEVRIVERMHHRYVDEWLVDLDARLGLHDGGGPAFAGGLVEELANVLYASYYLVPVIVIAVALRAGPDRASRYTLSLALTSLACGAVWLWLPSGGYHLGGSPTGEPFGPFTAAMRYVYASAPHHAAAFPSEHVGHAAAVAWIARAHGTGRWVWLWVGGIAAGTVLGEYHYALDGVAGWAVGCAAGAATMSVVRRGTTPAAVRAREPWWVRTRPT